MMNFWMASKRQDGILDAAARGDMRQLERLINANADFNVTDKKQNGATPLHLAVANGHEECVSRLLKEKKIKVNKADKNGLTPLHVAAAAHNMQIAFELIRAGADVNATEKDGNTPLHIAVMNNDIDLAHYLMQHDANVDVSNKMGRRPGSLAQPGTTLAAILC
eukprot:Clim_evm8s77 gene=Clim_evmTU8s77